MARVLAKKHLIGLKENALKSLSDQGVLVKPIDIVLHENVMPWIVDQMMNFLTEDDYVQVNAEEVVNLAFTLGQQEHI